MTLVNIANGGISVIFEVGASEPFKNEQFPSLFGLCDGEKALAELCFSSAVASYELTSPAFFGAGSIKVAVESWANQSAWIGGLDPERTNDSAVALVGVISAVRKVLNLDRLYGYCGSVEEEAMLRNIDCAWSSSSIKVGTDRRLSFALLKLENLDASDRG